MHFGWFLWKDELSIILNRQLFKSKEWQICKDWIENLVVSACCSNVPIVERFNKHFQEVFISDTSIEYLLDEYFLIRIFDIWKVIISMRINGVDYVIEFSDAINTVIY